MGYQGGNDFLERVAIKLENVQVIGNNNNLLLALQIKTSRTNSPLQYVPVSAISNAGFIAPANPQMRSRSYKKTISKEKVYTQTLIDENT